MKGDDDGSDILLCVKPIQKLQTSDKMLPSLSAEIPETTGHIDFPLGAFLGAQLGVGFLQLPVVPSNSRIHAGQILYGENFAFRVYAGQPAAVCLRLESRSRSP